MKKVIIFAVVAIVLAAVGYVIYKKYKSAKPAAAPAGAPATATNTGKPVLTVTSSLPAIQQHSTTTRA